MRRHYATIKNVVICFDDPRDVDGLEVIDVYCERDNGRGDFDFAECELPSYFFPRSSGFSEFELQELKKTLRNNERLIYNKARREGAWSES